MDTIETLNKMKDVIIEQGWCKRMPQNQLGEVCLVGARNLVLGLDTTLNGPNVYLADEVSDAIEAVLDERFHRGSNNQTAMWMFNDRVAESVNEVLDVIDQAIIHEKEKNQ